MAIHRNMQMRTVPTNRSEIFFAINTLKSSKAAGRNRSPTGLLLVASVISAELLLPFICKCLQCKIFIRKWKNWIFVKIEKGTRLECDNARGICVVSAVAKIINLVLPAC